MSPDEALAVLGLDQASDRSTLRAAYRRVLRAHHPDLAGPHGNAPTALVIEAYGVLDEVLARGGAVTGPAADDDLDPADPAPPEAAPPDAGPPDDAPPDTGPPGRVPTADPTDDRVASTTVPAGRLDEDSLAVAAPPPETYAVLHEAAGRIGDISYVDRTLGIIETMVRFEGGPTCSLLLTLQGRAEYTEVFCTLESIEAAPTPPIAAVLDALVAELEGAP